MLTSGLRGIAAAAALLLAAQGAPALSPADKCEASKLKEAGKYGFCRLKAEAKAVKTGSAPDYSKCDGKYGTKWPLIESKAAGQCPSNGDLTPIQAFIAQHTDDLAGALNGGPLPDCPGDLGTCNASLTSCNGSLSTCNTTLSTCNSNLSTCNGSLATVNAGSAVPADVLSGKTFSSGAGIGVSGTMANVGQQNVTPGTAPVAITQGYHDGTGTVAGDADLAAGNIKSGVNVFGVTGTLLNPPLRTGQTTSYGAGSDGALQYGAGRSFTDNGDGTITDNTTGLMWEKKSDDGSIHDKDNLYSWGTLGPYTMSGTMVTTFLAALNGGGGFAGYTDWRIPNLNELQSLVNYQAVPSVYSAFDTGCAAACTVTTCSCTFPSTYWSSTTYQDMPASAFYVGFGDGSVYNADKLFTLLVRAVRGGS